MHAVGINNDSGVILAIEKRLTSLLLEPASVGKYILTPYTYTLVNALNNLYIISIAYNREDHGS